jgi:hypothetical protein
MAAVEAAAMPAAAKEALGLLANRLDQLDAELAALDRRLAAVGAANPLSRLLAAVPGIGPLTALTLALSVAPERFANGRQGGRLKLPANLTLLPLPPYSPELNGAENLWGYLRANQLSHKVWDSHDAILDACSTAWNDLAASSERIRSLAHREWASVNV